MKGRTGGTSLVDGSGDHWGERPGGWDHRCVETIGAWGPLGGLVRANPRLYWLGVSVESLGPDCWDQWGVLPGLTVGRD